MSTEFPSTENGIRLMDLAGSAYQAYCAAYAVTADWERLDGEQKAAWQQLANTFEGMDRELEGLTGPQAGALVFGRWLRYLDKSRGDVFADLSVEQQVAWEAVARHLWQATDEEKAPDLTALEQSWRGWAEKQLRRRQAG